jgi:hypothetical protein
MASVGEEVQSLVVREGENCRQLRGEGFGEGQGCGVLENLPTGQKDLARRLSTLTIQICTLITA